MNLFRRLTLHQLNVVVVIEQYCSITQAAQHLGLPRLSVIAGLREIEALLGMPLFDCTSQDVEPTPFGAVLTRHARQVLAQMTHAEQEFKDLLDGTGGRVDVGTTIATSARLLPESIICLKTAHPRAVVSVREGSNGILMPALRGGELDVVVGRLPEYPQHEGIEHEPLYNEIACLVVRTEHPLADREPLTLLDLETCEWILPSPQTTLRRQIDKLFYENGLANPVQIVELSSIEDNIQFLLNANLVAAMPYQAVRALSIGGRLKMLPISLPTTLGPVGLSRRAGGRLSPVCEALLTEMRRVANILRQEEGEWRSILKI